MGKLTNQATGSTGGDGEAVFDRSYVLELRAEVIRWRSRAQAAERELARRKIADLMTLTRSRKGVLLPCHNVMEVE